MRPVLILGGLGGLLALLALATPSGAEPPRRHRPVAAGTAVAAGQDRHRQQARGGRPLRRDQGVLRHQGTNVLKYGERVEVIGDSTKYKGWLAIKPPSGSFDWIDGEFLNRQKDSSAIVHSPEDGAPVMAGSNVFADKPNVEIAKAEPGSIVRVLGDPMPANDQSGRWVPIAPTPREVRFIAAEDVTFNDIQVAGGPGNPALPPTGGVPQSPVFVTAGQSQANDGQKEIQALELLLARAATPRARLLRRQTAASAAGRRGPASHVRR